MPEIRARGQCQPRDQLGVSRARDRGLHHSFPCHSALSVADVIQASVLLARLYVTCAVSQGTRWQSAQLEREPELDLAEVVPDSSEVGEIHPEIELVQREVEQMSPGPVVEHLEEVLTL